MTQTGLFSGPVHLVRTTRGVIIAVLAFSVCASAQAQTCPADLTALAGQIQTPDIQAVLAIPIDSIVADDGGIDQAIANANASLARLQTTQANLGDADQATQVYVSDAILMTTAKLSALNCRKGS